MSISLLTNGWVCYARRVIKYILPYKIQIESKTNIELSIKDKSYLNLNISDILDKQINIKLDESQINIKSNENNLNIQT